MKSNRRWMGVAAAWVALAISAPGLVACTGTGGGAGDGPYTLTFQGSGYTPHDMQALRVAVVDVAADQVIATDEIVLGDGSFAFTFSDLLEKDKAYRIDFYADVNGDGECDSAGGDHVWSVSIDGVTADQDVSEDHSLDFSPSACDSFPVHAQTMYDLTFNGASFAPHEGQALHVALVSDDDDHVLDTDSTVIAGGMFTFSWADVLEEDVAYRLDFFADVDGSGTCGGADHIWRQKIPAVTHDVTVDFVHGIDFTPAACDSF